MVAVLVWALRGPRLGRSEAVRFRSWGRERSCWTGLPGTVTCKTRRERCR